MNGISLIDLCKTYKIEDKEIKALDKINLKLDPQKRNVLIGPSGCGKSTLLKALGGLLEIDSGKILNNGIKTSLVFQNPRLLPWLNLEENILFSNPDQKLSQKWIKIMGLEGFEKAYPSQLSGGMKARVSLARALIFPNNFMLLDEPFASLDEISKERLEMELLSYMKIKNSGFLFVSHDLEEALNLGQRLIIMKKGKIVSDFNFEDEKISKEILRDKFKKIIGEGNEK
ncbi:ABC transporter ATP-binding protein [Anaerococcus jeddahensis]|uniref:ABC transporter ATP-binding protein n=1 Tax=Anaerococcus jeddahensis TaxID=1673719 RepID=UPI0006725334|nr:ATP-binding cassette domain-containing protein [Anaerococcus jeddahensis]